MPETPLHWAGGKRWQIPLLKLLYAPHRHRRLVDPFCGALSVVLGLAPETALVNDACQPLMNFWVQLKAGHQVTIGGRGVTKDEYYLLRKGWNEGYAYDNPVASAGLFYVLNRTCFNGMWRENAAGHMTTSAGTVRKSIPPCGGPEWAEALAGVDLSCRSWLDLGDLVRPDDFVYADPPYDAGFVGYTPGGFDWPDHCLLADWLGAHPGPVVACNAATPRVRALYKAKGFALLDVLAPRRIAGNGDRQPAPELIMWKGL